MRKKPQILLMVGTLTLALAVLAWGQAATPPAGMAPGPGIRGGARMYNPATVETLSGEVTSVILRTPRRAGAPGRGHTEVMLKTDKETIPVHLGPSAYLESQNFKISQGDRVEVTGSRVAGPRQTFIIAAEVKKGPEVLKLRDAQGTPFWPQRRGWQRQQ